MRRLMIALCASLTLTVLAAVPAQAFCAQEPFKRAMRQADSVWWATVIDAQVSSGAAPGYWTLQVRIDDSLKGPASDGATGTVFLSTCGPFMSQAVLKRAAAGFVGDQMFLCGRNANGALATSGILLTPNMTPEEQYHQAVEQIIGVDDPQVTVSLGSDDGTSLPWVLVIGLGVFLVIVAAFVFMTKRSGRPTPPPR